MANFDEDYGSLIPVNTDTDGEILGGLLKIRNCIEAAAACVLVFMLFKYVFFFLPRKVNLALMIILMVFTLFAFLIGYKGVSITQYISRKISFEQNKTVAKLAMPKVGKKDAQEK